MCAIPQVHIYAFRRGTAGTLITPTSISNISVSESRSLGCNDDDTSPKPCREKRHVSATVTTNLDAQVCGHTLNELKLATTMAVLRPGAFVVKKKRAGWYTTTRKCDSTTRDTNCGPIVKIKNKRSPSIDKAVPKPLGCTAKYESNDV